MESNFNDLKGSYCNFLLCYFKRKFQNEQRKDKVFFYQTKINENHECNTGNKMFPSCNNYGTHEELGTYAHIFRELYSNLWQMPADAWRAFLVCKPMNISIIDTVLFF